MYDLVGRIVKIPHQQPGLITELPWMNPPGCPAGLAYDSHQAAAPTAVSDPISFLEEILVHPMYLASESSLSGCM